MLNIEQVLKYAIRPALEHIGYGGQAAEELVIGTGIIESGFTYLEQHNNGPARGLWQMEPATHDDIYENFLDFRFQLKQKVLGLLIYIGPDGDRRDQLTHNLQYAAAMCRLQYYRRPEALPDAGDTEAQSEYWKKFYNTIAGGGEAAKYVKVWNKHIGANTWT